MRIKKTFTAVVLVVSLLLTMAMPTTMSVVNAAQSVSVSYRTHVQSYGWQDWVSDGEMSGTSGESKRLEGIRIKLNTSARLGIQYTTHCQGYGWLPWSCNGQMSGTEGEAKRLEAIKIQLTGDDADNYDVYYRVHTQSYGWMGWAMNGAPAGTAGQAKRLEGIQIVVLPKGSSAPGSNYKGIKSASSVAYKYSTGSEAVNVAGSSDINVTYRTHVQNYGWQSWKYNGDMSGTSGQAKRLEGINIRLTNNLSGGGITYRTHVQSYGWQDWVSDGKMSGTSGQAKRLEAIEIKPTGVMADKYDVYYRVHAQDYGWLGWAKNGESAGTAGKSLRLEGIQIVLVKKGGSAPGTAYKGVTSTWPQAYYDAATDSVEWTVTQYGISATGSQRMFYTIKSDTGKLVVIDGGWEDDAAEVTRVINANGGHVDAWIITHPHPDHVGTFNAIMSSSAASLIRVDRIYTTKVNTATYKATAHEWDDYSSYEKFSRITASLSNVTYLKEGDTLDLIGLDMKVYHAWDSNVDALTGNLCNNGSLMFKISGDSTSMLFCSDTEKVMEKYIKKYTADMNSTYIQLGHHGNRGLTKSFYASFSPKGVFADAPGYILDDTSGTYDAPELMSYLSGVTIYRADKAPNRVVLR